MNVQKKRAIHTVTKIIIVILVGALVIDTVAVTALYIHHNSELKKEADCLAMPGKKYSINGHSMHIYETGSAEAEHTLLFLHGTMAADSVVAFRPLFDALKDDYRIIFIDRFGSGYSDCAGTSRDVETMLSELRGVLDLAGVSGPYTLVPFYTSGLIALYWTQKYPEEVEAIIGLDMTYPDMYKDYRTNEGMQKFYHYFTGVGGHRLIETAAPSDIEGLYTEKEMNERSALVARYCYTEDMLNEDLALMDNAETIGMTYFPTEIPVLEILSNSMMEPYLSKDAVLKQQVEAAKQNEPNRDVVDEYNKKMRDYLSGFDNVSVVELSGPAKLYEFCPDKIAQEIVRFFQEIK